MSLKRASLAPFAQLSGAILRPTSTFNKVTADVDAARKGRRARAAVLDPHPDGKR
jgi:hypothetical protein